MEKEEKKVSIKDKPLHTCDTEVTLEEYQKLVKYIPSFYWIRVIGAGILMLIIMLIAGNIKNIIPIIIADIVFMIIVMIIYKSNLNNLAKQSFNRIKKNPFFEENIKTEFYDNYLIRVGEKGTSKFLYSGIKKIIETDTNFYFKIFNTYIYFQKNRCDLETINFIRNICPDKLKNNLGNNSVINGATEIHNPKNVKIGMTILFIVTILSFFVASEIDDYIFKIKELPGPLSATTSWVMFLFLPIPILSIILGIRYKNAGYKGCTKNIVAGCIVAFILIMCGVFVFDDTNEIEYTSIYNFRNIISLDLPDDGWACSHNNWESYNEDIDNYDFYEFYFHKEDASFFENQIKNNNNWINKENMNTSIKEFIPALITSNYYATLYNVNLSEYNIIPNTDGKYEIYFMIYTPHDYRLGIYHYTYNYIK